MEAQKATEKDFSFKTSRVYTKEERLPFWGIFSTQTITLDEVG